MNHLKFPSIDQFRNVVKSVRERAAYHNVPIPALRFTGAVKLHGTNAGVVLDVASGQVQAQSRELVITPEQDNAGFAKFVTEQHEKFWLLFESVKLNAHVTGKYELNGQAPLQIGIYGEWCGKGIMKGTAISEVPKRFVIFKVRLHYGDDVDRWLSREEVTKVFGNSFPYEPSDVFFNIYSFKTWEMTIDFITPELAQAKLGELTLEVEERCPVGEAFGVTGIGEGIVWSCEDAFDKFRVWDLIFKVKGEKHSVSKVKTLAPVDVEKAANVREFAERVVTENRLEQMLDMMLVAGGKLELTSMGDFLKRVGNDVLKEESDTIEASGLEKRDVMPAVNMLAKSWFIKKVNAAVGL